MELEIGAILEGKVTGITKFGAFVALPGGRSGLVHISEVAYSYVNDVNDFLTVGQDVRVKIIGIDPNHRINLSIKQTLPPPPRPEHPPRQGGGHRNGGYPPRENHGEHYGERRGEHRGSDRQRGGAARPAGGNNPRSASREPQSFEDMMKQYMSESETKLSQLNRGERGRSRRRGRGGSGGSGGNF